MNLWMKKLGIFVLVMTMFTGISAESLAAMPRGAKVVAVKTTKKKKGLRFKKGLVKDFGRSFGTVNAEHGRKLEGEFLYHGEFAVKMDKLSLYYIFTDYDEFADYALTDDVPMNKLEGDIRFMVTGFKKKMTVPHFVKSFKKGLSGVKAKVLDGQPTSYYISERYAEISFKLKKNDTRKYFLRLELDEKDAILPDSRAWLTYEDIK